MYRQIPNLITLSRLVLTALFFIAINVADRQRNIPLCMWSALVIFLLAVASDALDGYLARSWKVESAFGRVVDPFADKILICGAFIFFAAPQLMLPHLTLTPVAQGSELTGVAPWMAVVLIAREFLVTGIRGLAESQGIDFRALWAGKLKMIVQCAAVVGVLVYLALAYEIQNQAVLTTVRWGRNIAIWAMLLVTIISIWQYISKAWRIIDA
ncbi:MAG: CDP-alcohol phosphatidyltransferase family protein [Phycisphaerae bacterium]